MHDRNREIETRLEFESRRKEEDRLANHRPLRKISSSKEVVEVLSKLDVKLEHRFRARDIHFNRNYDLRGRGITVAVLLETHDRHPPRGLLCSGSSSGRA